MSFTSASHSGVCYFAHHCIVNESNTNSFCFNNNTVSHVWPVLFWFSSNVSPPVQSSSPHTSTLVFEWCVAVPCMCATPPCTAGCRLVAWEASHISWSLRKEREREKKGDERRDLPVSGLPLDWQRGPFPPLVLSVAYMRVSCSLWCGGRACTRASCTWDWSKADLEREKLCLAACYSTTPFFFLLFFFP